MYCARWPDNPQLADMRRYKLTTQPYNVTLHYIFISYYISNVPNGSTIHIMLYYYNTTYDIMLLHDIMLLCISTQLTTQPYNVMLHFVLCPAARQPAARGNAPGDRNLLCKHNSTYIILYYITLYYHIMYNVPYGYITYYYIILYYIILYYIILYYIITLYYIVVCHH